MPMRGTVYGLKRERPAHVQQINCDCCRDSPPQRHRPLGQEHGRTIPLTEVEYPNELTA
jgi:hypothetical protein